MTPVRQVAQTAAGALRTYNGNGTAWMVENIANAARIAVFPTD